MKSNSPEPAPLCPSIIGVQEQILEALSILGMLKETTGAATHARLLRETVACLQPLTAELEELRSKCAALRAWGKVQHQSLDETPDPT